MSAQSTTRRPIDIDAEGALAALRRARLRAERVAFMTGTHLVIAVDGKPTLVAPRPEVMSSESGKPSYPG